MPRERRAALANLVLLVAVVVQRCGALAPQQTTSALNLRYDAANVARYFEARPLTVARRGAAIATAVVGAASPLALASLTRWPASADEFWRRPGTAARVVGALEELGPTYVKFGQALAARPDLVSEPLASALTALQDSMRPFDDAEAKAALRQRPTTVLDVRFTVVETRESLEFP